MHEHHRPTQADRVLRALERSDEHGVCRVDFLAPDVIDGGDPIVNLPARIKELKDDGHRITYGGSRHKCRVYRLLSSYYQADASGCWIWRGATNPQSGYGTLGRTFAHRVVYEQHRGPIADGLELDHLCRVPACVNPDHLEPVTHTENVRRGATTKLTAEQVVEIRASDRPLRELADQYGVSHHTIKSVRRTNPTTFRDVLDRQSLVDATRPAELVPEPPVQIGRGRCAIDDDWEAA